MEKLRPGEHLGLRQPLIGQGNIPPGYVEQEASILERETFAASPPVSDDVWYEEMIEEGLGPMVAKGYLEYRRNLPSLLSKHRGNWVAYHGSKRLTISPSKTTLYQKSLEGGVPEDELLVLHIDEDMLPVVGALPAR